VKSHNMTKGFYLESWLFPKQWNRATCLDERANLIIHINHLHTWHTLALYWSVQWATISISISISGCKLFVS